MRKKEPTPEMKKEIFREIGLEVKEPDGIHGYEIIFDENNIGLVTAYNVAVSEICNSKNNLGMFHQTGRSNEPGYHAWEVLGSKTDTQKLKDLFPLIHRQAQKTYAYLVANGLFYS
ncbi:MAG: hypothetical protein WCV92_05450 [Candidatus Buchananbacteria bacterium]